MSHQHVTRQWDFARGKMSLDPAWVAVGSKNDTLTADFAAALTVQAPGNFARAKVVAKTLTYQG